VPATPGRPKVFCFCSPRPSAGRRESHFMCDPLGAGWDRDGCSRSSAIGDHDPADQRVDCSGLQCAASCDVASGGGRGLQRTPLTPGCASRFHLTCTAVWFKHPVLQLKGRRLRAPRRRAGRSHPRCLSRARRIAGESQIPRREIRWRRVNIAPRPDRRSMRKPSCPSGIPSALANWLHTSKSACESRKLQPRPLSRVRPSCGASRP
jgi:hypothetical protein